MTISVFLLDDHEIVRRGIAQLLESEDDIEVVGEAGTAAQALARIPALRPDVAILDVRLPDGEGVTVCREVRSSVDAAPACLMLTSYSDDEALFGRSWPAPRATCSSRSPASTSSAPSAPSPPAARCSTRRPPPPCWSGSARGDDPADPRYASLSPQERRILGLIADGLTNRQIGAQMYLAEKTVKNYVSSLLHKLGFSRRTEAAVFAAELRRPGR